MADNNDKALAKPPLPRDQIRGLAHTKIQSAQLGDRTLYSHEATGILTPDEHFYVIPSYEDGQKKETYVVNLQGKLRMAGLAGCKITSWVDEDKATLDHMLAYGKVEWTDPYGEVHEFVRSREYDVQLEYNKSLGKKLKTQLAYIKKNQPKVYEEICTMFMEAADVDSGLIAIQNRILRPDDIIGLRLNQMEIRTHLRALCSSKALSQALTEWLRYIGVRLNFQRRPDGKIAVGIVRTVDVPNIHEGDSARMLFAGTSDEDDERETEDIIGGAEQDDSDAPGSGVTIDSETGEITEGQPAQGGLPPSADNAGPEARILAQINDKLVQLKWDEPTARERLYFVTEKDSLKDCTVAQLSKYHNHLVKALRDIAKAEEDAAKTAQEANELAAADEAAREEYEAGFDDNDEGSLPL